MNLIEALQTVPDYRSARGKRHPLWILLVFIVMGNLAGYRGNRPLEEFARRYGMEIARSLQIELDALPSFSTFRRAHIGLDFAALSNAFALWMHQHVGTDADACVEVRAEERPPIPSEDGQTRFIHWINAFAQNQGIAVELAALTTTDNSELQVVRYLLEKLRLTGVDCQATLTPMAEPSDFVA